MEIIPENDDAWRLYKTLRKILALVTSMSIQSACSLLLKTIIHEHHTLALHVFDQKLKAKDHHLIHYPTVMTSCRPLVHLWSMRFESKHRESKM